MSPNRQEHERIKSLQGKVARAEADFARLKAALARAEKRDPDNVVEQAMIGADLERAFLRLQDLVGLPPRHGSAAVQAAPSALRSMSSIL